MEGIMIVTISKQTTYGSFGGFDSYPLPFLLSSTMNVKPPGGIFPGTKMNSVTWFFAGTSLAIARSQAVVQVTK